MLVLASKSPRRSELLRSAGIPFSMIAADVDETVRDGEVPEEYAVRVAEEKAMAVTAGAGDIVLGADTIVVIDGQILGKPADAEDAVRMLTLLQGRRHDVITGICVRKAEEVVREWAATKVWFTAMSAEQIREYVSSGEPMDKAGAYAIQGLASKFIERIDGSYANVVGLPVALVYKHLQ
jgi:septum formation protein